MVALIPANALSQNESEIEAVVRRPNKLWKVIQVDNVRDLGSSVEVETLFDVVKVSRRPDWQNTKIIRLDS